MTRDPRRILLASFDDPHDPGSWSGIPHRVLGALERRFARVGVLTGVPIVRSFPHTRLRRLLGDRRYPLWPTEPALAAFGRALERAVDETRPDAVISVSSHHLLRCRPEVFDRVPTVMFSDAPWELWQEAYRGFTEWRLRTRAIGRAEAAVARRIAGTVYASDWAVDWFVARHGVPRDRLVVAPFGANLTPSTPPPPRDPSAGPLRLLFVGVDWPRKGGPFAVEVTRALRALGRDARLDVVGCTPPIAAADRAFVEVHGVLSLHASDRSARLERLFAAAHFLLVPTRAECFGIVFAEAGAFAVPAVAGAVHAVPSIVEDGANGLLIAASDTPAAVARRIRDLAADPDRHARMAATARARYEARFRWDLFVDRLVETIDRAPPAAR